MSTSVGFPTLTIQGWAPPDKSGYMEQISKRAPALIAPYDAPFYKGIEHRPVVGYQFDWLTDNLDPNLTEAGNPFETEPVYQTTLYRNRLNNIVQMFRKVWSISEYSEIIAKNGGISSGIQSEVARQITLKLKVLARNIERTMVSNITGGLEGASTNTSSTLSGYYAAITAGNSTLALPNTIGNFAVTAGQDLSNYLDETTFSNQIALQFSNGASPDLWFLTTVSVAKMIGRTFNGRTNSRENTQRGEHVVDSVVDKYVAPVGGEVMIEADRSIGDGGALIDREQISIGEADPIRVFRADPGSFQNLYGRIRTYCTMLYGNPQASGGWTTSNTPAAANA